MISCGDGIIGLLFINLTKFAFYFVLGIYLETLFVSDKLLKKYLTILSSKEWKLTTAIIPFFSSTLVALINP